MHTPLALAQTTQTQNRSAKQPSLSSATSRRSFFALERVCALLLVVAAACVAAHAQGPSWTQDMPTGLIPSGSNSPAMAYDAAHKQIVLFGGMDENGTVLDQTWIWNGIQWTQPNPTHVPTGRYGQVMAYDSVHQRVVMFGGLDSVGAPLSDTQLWDGTDWTAGPAGPSARSFAGMAYDAAHGEVVLFGGQDSNGNPMGDTWLWNGSSWSTGPAGPSPRSEHTMAFDSTHSQVVLFGGYTTSYQADTWLWDGTAWMPTSPGSPPPARVNFGMADDAAQGGVVMFGGFNANSAYHGFLNDTWTWNGSSWTSETISASPDPRADFAMAYDAALEQTFLFGGFYYDGFSPTYFTGTWAYAVPTTLTVTSSADDGSSGTLRTLLADVAVGGTINFASNLNGQTITLDCAHRGTIVIDKNVTISGPGANNLAISGNNACEVFQVNSGVTATISGVTIENGKSQTGAGINNAGVLTVSNSNISGNSATSNGGGFGGGIYNNAGTLTVSNSTLSGNSADSEGGGIFDNSGTVTVSNSTFSTNSSYYGGGIYNSFGTVAMSTSTFSGNHSTQDDGQGGGIFNGGTMTVSNSTFSGNSASEGGGIFNYGTLTLSNSTFAGNSASYQNQGGALFNFGYGGSTVTFKGVLMANNGAGKSCANSGTLVSDGYNLEDGSSCNFNQTGDQSNVTGAASYLGPLQDNGGPTQTFALLAGSTAIDAIPLSACTDAFGNPVTNDQRGVTRPQGASGKCDIGAFEVQQTPTANVCPNGQTSPAPCSYPITLRYYIPEGTTLGSDPVQVVTQGKPNLDFNLTPSNICSPVGSANCVVAVSPCASLAGPAYCTVQVTFAPLAPGLRMGAVNLTDSNNNPVATTMIPGLGNGPAIAFGPGVQTTLNVNVGGMGLSNPQGLAVDAAGDLFIADAGNKRIVEVPAGCTSTSCQTTVPASGLMGPQGVAVDGAGDVFIADPANNQVIEIAYLGGGIYGPQTTVPASGLMGPQGVAVDGAGNILIADTDNNQVLKLSYLGNGTYGPQTTIGSAIGHPTNVTVDAAGNVFIVQGSSTPAVEVTPNGVQTTLPFQSGTFQIPAGVAVDAAGDVFATDPTNGYATELSPLSNGTYGTQTFLVESNSAVPTGVTVDGAGDVFVVENGYNEVVKFPRSQPPSLSFASTALGQTSSDSPQSVTVQNIGNQALDAVSPGLVVTGPNFVQVAGLGTPADCTSTFALAAGASCNLSVSFKPQSSGPLTSTAVFTDNALNASPAATQSIGLSGMGAGVPPAITSANSATFTVGVAGSFTVTTTGTPTPSIMESGALPNGLTFQDNGDGTGTLKGTPLANGGNFSISFTAQNGVGSPATQAFTIMVLQLPSFTSANYAVFTIGVAGSFTVTTAGVPTASIKEAGALPNGLSFHDNGDGTGTLKGTPLVFNGGNFSISFSAQNGIGSPVTEAFTIILQQPPTFTSASSAMFTIAAPNSFTVTTAGFPAPNIKESGALPPGVTLVDNHNGTATLSGTPSAGGSFPIVLSAANVVTTAQQNFTLNVAGVSISPSPLSFGTAYLNSSTTLSLTLTNMTKSTVTIGSLSITPGTANAAAYKAVNHCTAALKTGKSCTIAVTFLANAVGLETATLNVSDSTIPTPHQIGLSAYVIDPVAQFSPTKLAFGTQAVNSSTTLPVTLTNAGQTPLNMGGISITGTNSGEFSEVNSCPASLASGANCTISVTLTPTVKGARTGTLTVIDNAAGGQSTAALSGTGH